MTRPLHKQALPLKSETSMPSKPYQYKGELEGVVNTKQQTHSLRLNPPSNGT
ncbi:hypothetical protein THOE12_20829 [Vibrio rotiferianus]|nr:hypothetical protein THOE12_20829 [Vibrio rotiferianus]